MSTILLFGVSGADDITQAQAEHRAYMAGACDNGLDTYLAPEREDQFDLIAIEAAYEEGRRDEREAAYAEGRHSHTDF